MTTVEKKSLRVGKYVNTEHVDTAIRHYKQERWIHNSERIGKEDSLSVWYSAEELEEFVQTVRAHGADGVRMYFGVYGEDAPRPGLEGRQTIVLVATKSKEEGERLQHKDFYITRNGKADILAFNMGIPCPPLYCPGTPASPGGTGTLGLTFVKNGNNGMSVI